MGPTVVNSSAFYTDFTTGAVPSGGTFSRASTAWANDNTGALQSYGNNVSRVGYNFSTLASLGMLIEEARTNKIRNSTMQGASVGVLPTNWSANNIGMAVSVVATGTSNGMQYVDVQVSGTPSSSPQILYLETITGIACAQNDVFTGSLAMALVGGSTANVNSITMRNAEYNASSTYLSDSAVSSDLRSQLTASLKRIKSDVTYVIKNATAAYARPYIGLSVTASQPVNITLRIAAPQFETGATMTSIIPTSGSVVTRAEESLTIANPAWLTATGSMKVVFQTESQPALDVDATLVQLDSGADTASTRVRVALKNGTIRLYGSTGEVNIGTYTENTQCTVEVSWNGSIVAGRINGGTTKELLQATAASFTTVRFGRGSSGGFLNGGLYSFAFYTSPYLIAAGRQAFDLSTSPFAWLPYTVQLDPSGAAPAVSSYSFYAERPNAGTTYYLSPNGLDANDGLTERTPLLTMATALAKPNVGTIILASGMYTRNSSNQGTVTLARDLTLMTKDGKPAVFLGSDQNVAWTVNGSFSNVYQRTRNNITGVWDAKIPDSNGDWVRYTQVASVAAVSAQAGSYYNDGSVTYVRTLDDRMPDNDIHVTLTIGVTFQGGFKVWMDNVQFAGLNYVKFQSTASNAYPIVYGRNVKIKYVPDTNGYSMLGTDSYFMDCEAAKNWLDGFNYHLNTSRTCQSFEIGCIGRDSLYTGNTSQNGTTTHEGSTAVRLNGQYGRTNGPTIADVNSGTTSLMVNCTTFGTGVSYLSGLDDTDTTKQYVINCTASSTLADVFVNLIATFRYYGSQTFTQLGTGTLTKITDLSQIFAA